MGRVLLPLQVVGRGFLTLHKAHSMQAAAAAKKHQPQQQEELHTPAPTYIKSHKNSAVGKTEAHH